MTGADSAPGLRIRSEASLSADPAGDEATSIRGGRPCMGRVFESLFARLALLHLANKPIYG